MNGTYTNMDSPVGPLRILWGDNGLHGIHLRASGPLDDPGWSYDRGLRCPATEQLRAYFDGSLRTFDLPLVLEGTPFQQTVWRTLSGIPYGGTISYAELARRVGRPRAVRAVGAANGRNPIPIVLPCHRVIGSGGELRGYAGGLDLKEKLLTHEGALTHKPALF